MINNRPFQQLQNETWGGGLFVLVNGCHRASMTDTFSNLVWSVNQAMIDYSLQKMIVLN